MLLTIMKFTASTVYDLSLIRCQYITNKLSHDHLLLQTLKWKLHPENLCGWHGNMSIIIHSNTSTAKKGNNKPAELMNAAKLIRNEFVD